MNFNFLKKLNRLSELKPELDLQRSKLNHADPNRTKPNGTRMPTSNQI